MNPWAVAGSAVAGLIVLWKGIRVLFCGEEFPAQIGLEDYFEARTPMSHDKVSAGEKPPEEPGLYAWYFDHTLVNVVTSGCLRRGDFTLLYIGQASNLRRRILKEHYGGNAAGSTLRLTLGCLLQDELSIRLLTTSRGRYTFGRQGKKLLSEWMQLHARVAWASLKDSVIDWPSLEGEGRQQVLDRAEQRMIANYRLPLNLEHNRDHICGAVKRIRHACQVAAKVGK